jgi:hypothetical protein
LDVLGTLLMAASLGALPLNTLELALGVSLLALSALCQARPAPPPPPRPRGALF